MKYTQEYRIYENDVDFRKMATLGSLLRYCQQIGTEDAEHYGITPELYASTHTSYVLAKLALHITHFYPGGIGRKKHQLLYSQNATKW